MRLKKFKFGNETVLLRSAACKRTLAVIACASVLAGCNSMPSFSDMGDGISQTYTNMESGVREKYNETFTSTDQASENEAVSATSAVDETDKKVTLGRSGVKRLQGRLASLAFRPGPVDGVMGSQTVRAIRRYQAAHNLSVTGKVSSQFLQHLDDTYASAKAEHMLTNSPR